MEKLKKYKGITLIALVVTILVLLILAGVALNLALGENGLFNQTKLAVEKYKDAQNKEEEQLQIATNAMLGNVEVREGTVTIDGATLQGILDRLTALEQTSQGAMAVPVGTVISCMRDNVPTGYLACDGTEYNISQYPELAEEIRKIYNGYNTETEGKFKVPDLRGEFLRGTGTNAHENQGSGENVGIHQDGTQHQYFVTDGALGNNSSFYIYLDPELGIGEQGNLMNVDKFIKESSIANMYSANRVASANRVYGTSRPTNTSVLYCIKY